MRPHANRSPVFLACDIAVAMKLGLMLLTGFLTIGMFHPAVAQQPEEGWSNLGAWKFELRGNADGDKEIWIIPEPNPAGAKKMTTTPGWGNMRMHISPDDKFIVLEDGGGSLGIDLRVFRAGATPAEYVEDENLKLSDLVEAWAVKKAGAPDGSILGHRYVHAHGWSADGKKLLVSISGREGELSIPGWFAIYDFGSGSLSFDLGELNR